MNYKMVEGDRCVELENPGGPSNNVTNSSSTQSIFCDDTKNLYCDYSTLICK